MRQNPQRDSLELPLLLLLGVIVVLHVISSAVFLSVGPSLINIRFGSSLQLLSRGFLFRHYGWGRQPLGGGRKSSKTRVVDETVGMAERASMPLIICLSDPHGRDEEVAQDGV